MGVLSEVEQADYEALYFQGLYEMIEWAEELRALLAELGSQDLECPLGTNEVRRPPSRLPPELPGELEPLYAVSNGASMPDVHIGYFVDTAERASQAAQRGEPMRVEGVQPANIDVFGSDGGGGRFAISREDGSIYYLPASGVVCDGVYHEEGSVQVERVARTLDDFLRRLKDDVEAFVRAREGHRYMVR